MAKLDAGNRKPQFGNSRPWSNKATRRRRNLNIQKVKVVEGGRVVTKRMTTADIRTLMKTK